MQVLSNTILKSMLILTVSFASSSLLLAQKGKSDPGDCSLKLDEAKLYYNRGQLDRVTAIEECALNPKSMSREKRIEALQLLTETYLYDNKIGKANKSFMKLLEANPLHEVDSANQENSWDLVYLSRTYSRRPIFSVYFGAGANLSLMQQLQNYGVDNTGDVKPAESYFDSKNIVIGLNGCIGAEIPLIYGFDLAIEGNFSYRTYAFTDSMYISTSSNNPTASGTSGEAPSNILNGSNDRIGQPLLYSTLNFKENQFWIDLPVMLKYNVTFKNILPYVYAGGGPSFLLSANISGIERETSGELTGGNQVVQPPTKPILLTAHTRAIAGGEQAFPSMRTSFNWIFVAGAGVKFRLGRNFLFIDARYTRMFLNNVNRANRYSNPDLLYRYGHVDNDFRTDNFALTVGFTKAFYQPRKKREFNPVSIDNKFDRWLEKERKNIKRETDEELKGELDAMVREAEKEKPSLIEDVERGRVGTEIIRDRKKEFEKIKNK